ncbi:hypothetical protein D5S18_01200 [Nocardia panacis]|uniref:DUF6875 domain-containing protein n=1 Tax=Nocardia panacis TaxID=2340916 RepID=A0A3A4KWU9_9NOCA|nr:hypothetical protein [Nocardia panacis]RJO79911.1 hypothetical protein D5S18_01200 [Nocardia panacis]
MTPRARFGRRTGLQWRNIYDDSAAWVVEHPEAAALVAWIDDYLVHPHPELGREGAVCPFVRQAIRRRTLWAAVVAGGDGLTATRMADAVDDAVDIHRQLRAADPDALLSSLTLFPGLSRTTLVDAVHAARKSGVVEQGMMLGQFYPDCPVPGLWNREFRPLDAPLPMLIIRRMMSTDFPFLAARSDWLYAYLSTVAPDLPRKLRRSIAERIRVEGPAAEAITELRVHAPGEHAR